MRRVCLLLVLACSGGAQSLGERIAEGSSEPEAPSETPAINEESDQEHHAEAVAAESESEADETSRVHPAIEAVLFGDVLVVREREAAGAPLVLSAYNVFDDRRLWTSTLSAGADMWIQRFDDGHLLVRHGQALDVVDVRDGSAIATQTAQGRGRFLWREAGVCLLNSDCRVNVIDCSDARPLQSLRVGVSTRRPIRPSANYRDPGCLGGPNIIGRAGNTLIIAMSNWETLLVPPGRIPRTGADSWLAIDALSGDILWTQQHPCGHCDSAHAGVVGDFAWVAEDDQLTLIHGATGQVARRLTRPGIRMVFAVKDAPARLQVLTDSALELVDVARGRRIERHSIPTGSVAVMSGAVYPSYGASSVLASDGTLRFVWLGGDGATLHSETVPAGRSIHEGVNGGRWTNGSAGTSDASGQPIRNHEFSVERFREPAQPPGPPNRARVSRNGQGIADFDHDAWSLGEATQGAVHAVALFVSSPEWRTEAEVRVIRVSD